MAQLARCVCHPFACAAGVLFVGTFLLSGPAYAILPPPSLGGGGGVVAPTGGGSPPVAAPPGNGFQTGGNGPGLPNTTFSLGSGSRSSIGSEYLSSSAVGTTTGGTTGTTGGTTGATTGGTTTGGTTTGGATTAGTTGGPGGGRAANGVPEIDPNSLTAGLALVIGSVLALRGSRRTK
jgi:hypothetical protein